MLGLNHIRRWKLRVKIVSVRRFFIVTLCSTLCLLAAVNHFSNVSDILRYYSHSGAKTLPLTIQCNLGRLGNQMCTYATLYGLSALNQRRPFTTLSCNSKHLKPHFDRLSVPEFGWNLLYIKWNAWNLLPYLQPEDTAIPPNSNFIDGFIYPCSYTFFDHVRNEIRQEFQFSAHLQQYARNVLRKANVHHLKNLTYVGMHVRRGDYLEAWLNPFGGVAVNMEYFEKAVKYFRTKYQPVVFVLVSDDRVWCIEHLSCRFGIYVSEDPPTAAHDLAVLANCNHTVITYGTFGFWGAYLAGGEVVYFDKFLMPNTTFSREKFVFQKMYPPQWKGIVTANVSELKPPYSMKTIQ